MKDFWDERYRQSDFVYGDQPNVYFAEKLAELTPGEALFPAEGEGRNAIYAATQGFEVEAFDQSEEGRKKAMKLAEKKSVKINYATVSADTISYEKESFDLLVMVFAHFPETLRRDLHRRFSSLVKKGGKIILEGFSKEHSKFQDENPNIMETKNEYEPSQYPKFQLKYLGFGEGEQLHKDLENGINAPEKEFEIKTSSDKTMPGNEVEFTLKFNKIENGSVFMNFYNAKLTKENGDILSHNFSVNRVNTFTAKEAINLLEGRTVKIEFHNPKTEKIEPAFAKLNFNEPKTEKGNYNFQNFYKNYGVDTAQIVEKSKLIFDKPEWKESTIKSLEKGNIVKVKFELDDKVVEGKAVLNPQYKNLNLYDSDMNRINTNKPLEGLEQDNKHEKNNVKEQSIKR